MKILADGTFFHDLALELLSDAYFERSDLRDAVVTDLMVTAISTAQLNQRPQHTHPDSSTIQSLQNAQKFLQTCIKHRDELCGTVLNEVANTQDLTGSERKAHAHGVLIPFVGFIANNVPPSSRSMMQPALESLTTQALEYWDSSLDGTKALAFARALVQIARWEDGWEFFRSW